ncbi:hypothetical protein [Kitasatospora sp. NPDC005856]
MVLLPGCLVFLGSAVAPILARAARRDENAFHGLPAVGRPGAAAPATVE